MNPKNMQVYLDTTSDLENGMKNHIKFLIKIINLSKLQ